MEQYSVLYIDCVNSKCKNFQRVNTIEIFFFITTDDRIAIEYSFHKIDFKIWKDIFEIHKKDVINPILYDFANEEITDISEDSEYYYFRLESEDFNLYRNINLIMYLEKKGCSESKNISSINDSIRNNVWKV